MKKKDSELFKPLVITAEDYLKDFCNGKRGSDEKAKIALKVLSLNRRILRLEKEQKAIQHEWKKLIAGINKLRKLTRKSVKTKKSKIARSKIRLKPLPR